VDCSQSFTVVPHLRQTSLQLLAWYHLLETSAAEPNRIRNLQPGKHLPDATMQGQCPGVNDWQLCSSCSG